MKGEEYQCGMCRGTFEKVSPDRDAVAECDALFGPTAPDDRVLVCHKCWLAMTSAVPPPGTRRLGAHMDLVRTVRERA